jgi:hypothetical protein
MKHFKIILISMYLLMLFYPVWSNSDSEKKPLLRGTGSGTSADPYIVPRAVSAIKVDGKLEDKEWEKALKFNLLYESWPGDAAPAPVHTECYLTYDNSNFYIGFRAVDPDPSKLRAYYYERDKIWADDFVAVFLDTFNDKRQAYGFRSNPYGVQWDDIRTRTVVGAGVGAPVAYDAIFQSRGQVYDWGYTVEMAIPFNQLRFQRTKGAQVWGFNARRIYSRHVLHDLDLIRVDRNNDCLMCQYVKIKGFEGAKPGRSIELVPTLIAARTDERLDFPEGDFEKRSQEVEPGLTARWGITHNMTLSGTVNPDFSQVEADTLQLDLNEPFALFYDERRPFFYEGAEFFNTSLNAVYTRTMRDPSWGFKLAGKAGTNTLGTYVVRDDITNLIFPGSFGSTSTSLDIPNTSSVFRYKRDFGANYTFGLLGTNREGDDYFNRLGGVDAEIRLSKKDRLQFQFLASSTRYPEETAVEFDQQEEAFGGTALDFKYSRDARHLDFSVGYQSLTRGFRADLGFIPRVNYRRGNLSSSYTWYGKEGWVFWQLALIGEYIYTQDQDENLIASGANFYIDYRGPWQSYGTLTATKARETYNQVKFDLFSINLYSSISPTQNLEFQLLGDFGDRIDYANTRLGQRIRLNPTIVLKPSKHMRLTLTHLYERLNVDNDRLYTANISELRGIYHINVRTFFRAILQYTYYDYNTANYLFPVNPRYKHLASQLLFTYRINPRTLLFVGYSDNYAGNQDFNLTQRDRTFFIKISYAWTM